MVIDVFKSLSATAEMRRHSEKRVHTRPADVHPPPSEDATERLVHELEVHQIELEMQNTELRQARFEIESALEKYTDLYEFAPVGYFTLDRTGTIHTSNLAGATLLGGDRQSLPGQHFFQFIKEKGRPAFKVFLDRVFCSQGDEVCEIELVTTMNLPVIVQVEGHSGNSGEECLIALIDITDRKKLETEIQDAREYAESIVETVRDPLVVLNAQLKILTANHSFYQTFKVTPEETIGNFIYELGNRQWDIPKLRVLFEEILHYQTVFNSYEVEHDFLGIGRKTILLNARQIYRKNIGSHIILLAMEDITERKQLAEDLQKAHDQLGLILKERTRELTCANIRQQEVSESNQRLEELSRTKSDFLANMSHELRTPLNSVIGFSEVLQDCLFGPINEKQQEYVANILTSGRHLLSLINDILDLSKVESGNMELELTKFSIIETVDDSLTMLREKALQGGITLNLKLPRHVDVHITADQRKLKQILFNLLSNAVKFTSAGGTVDVSVERDDDLFKITVSDTGVGIRNEDIPKLFKAFTQLESVYTKEHEGTGLGLALTRQMVELHGGKIWVESQFGLGSRFSFTIPITQLPSDTISQPGYSKTVDHRR